VQGCVIMKTKLILGIASTLFLSACGQPEPITYESLAWVNNYYIEHPAASKSAIAGGWLFRGAKENGTEIRVDFLITGPMNPDPAKRQATLKKICPSKSEPIWQVLPKDNKLVINVRTEDHKFKDERIC